VVAKIKGKSGTVRCQKNVQRTEEQLRRGQKVQMDGKVRFWKVAPEKTSFLEGEKKAENIF